MFTVEEVEKALADYQQRFWDEEHPDYDEDLDDDGVQDIWGYFTYDTNDRKPIAVPGLGDLEYVASGTELDQFGEKVEYVIVRIGDQTFRMNGWTDSWGGDSGWDGPFYEVVEKEVVTKVWEKKA